MVEIFEFTLKNALIQIHVNPWCRMDFVHFISVYYRSDAVRFDLRDGYGRTPTDTESEWTVRVRVVLHHFHVPGSSPGVRWAKQVERTLKKMEFAGRKSRKWNNDWKLPSFGKDPWRGRGSSPVRLALASSDCELQTKSPWTKSSWTKSSWTKSSWTKSSWTKSSWTKSPWTKSSWTKSSWTKSPWMMNKNAIDFLVWICWSLSECDFFLTNNRCRIHRRGKVILLLQFFVQIQTPTEKKKKKIIQIKYFCLESSHDKSWRKKRNRKDGTCLRWARSSDSNSVSTLRSSRHILWMRMHSSNNKVAWRTCCLAEQKWF